MNRRRSPSRGREARPRRFRRLGTYVLVSALVFSPAGMGVGIYLRQQRRQENTARAVVEVSVPQLRLREVRSRMARLKMGPGDFNRQARERGILEGVESSEQYDRLLSAYRSRRRLVTQPIGGVVRLEITIREQDREAALGLADLLATHYAESFRKTYNVRFVSTDRKVLKIDAETIASGFSSMGKTWAKRANFLYGFFAGAIFGAVVGVVVWRFDQQLREKRRQRRSLMSDSGGNLRG